ncbi:MAG: PAS domain-containing protein [Pseudorhodoplanes sp.]
MQQASAQFAARLGEALLATASDAILAIDRRGMICFWNPGAARVFGFTAEEAIGASLDLIIPERLRKRHWDGWERVMATGATRYGDGDLLAVPAATKDGRQISIEFTIILLRDNGRRIVGMGAVLRDVTARFEEMRRLKRELAAARAQPVTAGDSGK